MSKYSVVFTEDAAKDLDKIKKFYARQITRRKKLFFFKGLKMLREAA